MYKVITRTEDFKATLDKFIENYLNDNCDKYELFDIKYDTVHFNSPYSTTMILRKK